MNYKNLTLAAGFLVLSMVASMFSPILQLSLFGVGASLFVLGLIGR